MATLPGFKDLTVSVTESNPNNLKHMTHQTIHHRHTKIDGRVPTKIISRYSHQFFFKLSVSFVGEKRWESTNLGVTPNDVLTVLKTKVKYILLYTLHRRRCCERSGIVYSSKNRKVGR